jgi:hypothetical protein
LIPDGLLEGLEDNGIALSEDLHVEPRSPKAERGETGRWVLVDLGNKEKYSIVEAGPNTRVHEWDNWYDFPGSYWVAGQVIRDGPRLIWQEKQLSDLDRGEPWRWFYFVHMMVGHHGVFSLTPIWLLSVLGLILLSLDRTRQLHVFALAVALISIVVIAFYVTRPELQRNYGGVSCGFRWLIWLAPLWLVAMIAALDWIGGGERDRSLWWIVALALLLLSAVSVSYAALDPWSHPWVYQYWKYLEWPVSSHDLLGPG